MPSPRSEWWLSSRAMTVWVLTAAYGELPPLVLSTAPVARWAVGKPLRVLISWMERQGGLQVKELSP